MLYEYILIVFIFLISRLFFNFSIIENKLKIKNIFIFNLNSAPINFIINRWFSTPTENLNLMLIPFFFHNNLLFHFFLL